MDRAVGDHWPEFAAAHKPYITPESPEMKPSNDAFRQPPKAVGQRPWWETEEEAVCGLGLG